MVATASWIYFKLMDKNLAAESAISTGLQVYQECPVIYRLRDGRIVL